MGLIKAGMGALGGTLQINGRNFSTVSRCQRRYSLQKDKTCHRTFSEHQRK